MHSPSGVYLRKNARRKYDAILKSACRHFLKHGYAHTSMDAIAADAKVSKQTVYSYFNNKNVLFCKMVEDECVRHSPSEKLLSDPALKPADALTRIGKGYLDMVLGARGLAILRLVMTEAERHPKIAKLFFDCGPLGVQRMLVHYLQQQIAHHIFEIDDVESAAEFFLSMIKGRYRLRLSLKLKPALGKKELHAHVAETVRLFFKMYGKN